MARNVGKTTKVPGYVLMMTEEERHCLAFVLNDENTRAPIRFSGAMASILARFNLMELIELDAETPQVGPSEESKDGETKTITRAHSKKNGLKGSECRSDM